MKKMIYATIYTMDRDHPTAEAMGIEEDRIFFTGTREEAQAIEVDETLAYPDKVILPGFIDTHVHVIPSGLFMTGADLSQAKDLAEVLEILRVKAAETPEGKWVIGAFFQDKHVKEKRFPDRYELDSVSTKHPIFICHNDLHPFSFNSKALELLQFDPALDGICTDENGELTGCVVDPACMDSLERIYSFFSDEDLIRGCKAVDEMAVANGVTTVFGKDSIRVLKLREQNQDLFHAEFKPMWMTYNTGDWEGLQEILEDEALREKTCICTFADGAFDGWSASMIEPYEGRPTEFGMLLHTDEEHYGFAKAAREHDLQFSTHAIGDHAIEQVIRVYERVLKENPKEDHRFRIEHFELPTKPSIKKAAELGIALGMQPLLIEVCEGMDLSGYACFIGDRAGKCSPYRSILDQGILVGGGTDFPVTPMRPLHGARICMTQPTESERITLMECLEMNTCNAAKLGFLEDRKGMLRPGMDADFIVLDQNPFAVPVEALSDIRVEQTYARGKLVYSKA